MFYDLFLRLPRAQEQCEGGVTKTVGGANGTVKQADGKVRVNAVSTSLHRDDASIRR